MLDWHVAAGAALATIPLALVKRITEVHGGRIRVESQGKGLGSTLLFTLGAPARGGAR